MSLIFSTPKMLISLLRGLVVAADELGRVDEHAARAAGRVEDRAVVGLDHLDDELHDGGGREVLAALLHEGRRRTGP